MDLRGIEHIIDEYRARYHEIYAKGLRYFMGNRIVMYVVKNSEIRMFNVRGEEDEYWVIFLGEDWLCSCPDYFFNIAMRKTERKYCSHIIACIMYLAKISENAKDRNLKQESTSPTISELGVGKLLEIVYKNIERVRSSLICTKQKG